jgi:hypothetical protein
VEKWGPGPLGPGTVCDRWVNVSSLARSLGSSAMLARSCDIFRFLRVAILATSGG